MKTYIYLWNYLAEFLEREMFQTKVFKKIKAHPYVQLLFFFENHAVY